MGSGLPVSLAASGSGLPQLVPAGATNGSPLPGTRPPDADRLRIYLGANDSVSYALVPNTQNAPTAAPTPTVTISGPGVFDEPFPASTAIFFTARNGAPVCRWI